MSSKKTKRLIISITLLLLVGIIASSVSCSSLSNRPIGGDWNPDTLNTGGIVRLPLPERSSWYHNFESTVIRSQTALDNFMADRNNTFRLVPIEDYEPITPNSSDYMFRRSIIIMLEDSYIEFLQSVDEWNIDFSTHNIILYRHTETSGGTVVTLDEPSVVNDTVTISLHRGALGITDDMAYYCYAYKVSKSVTSVSFDVDGKHDFSFQLIEPEPIVGEGSSLIATIEGIECEIEAYFWRDFEPISPPDGRPLIGVITIRPIYAYSLPQSWVVEEEVIVTHNDEIWETVFTENNLIRPHWEGAVRNGPKWGPGTSVDVTFKLTVTYLTFAPSEDFIKTYTVILNDVPIDATS